VESTEGEMLILNVASLAFELGIRPSDLLSSSLSDFVLDMKIAELYKRKVENIMRERT
jgi:integrase